MTFAFSTIELPLFLLLLLRHDPSYLPPEFLFFLLRTTSSEPCRQLEPARDLSLENPSRIILRCRGLQTRHVFRSISRYRILGLIRVIQIHEFMQQAHLPGRFVRFLHDGLSRLLHESVG